MINVCVFCGAGDGRLPQFGEAAEALGTELAHRGLGLVYGGASVGLMGRVADAVLAAGGTAVGVLPSKLRDKEIAHTGLTALHIVDTLEERKKLMFDLSDAFAALPGGLGTLDELSEVLTWAQLGYHDKPMGLLNVAGYFDHLLAYLDRGVSDGLLKARHLARLRTADSPAALLDQLLPAPQRSSAGAGGTP